MAIEDEIKNALAKNALVIGTRTVVKALKTDNVKSVIIASNTPESVKKDLQHYASTADTPLHNFNGTGKQLGTFLGKPFPVATLAIAGESEKKARKK